jgi:hypothetical protein
MWQKQAPSRGGLRERFKSFPLTRISFNDPFSNERRELDTPLRQENWLLRRFCPQVVKLRLSPRLPAPVKKAQVFGRHHLLVTFGGEPPGKVLGQSSGSKVLDLVLRLAPPSGAVEELAARGAECGMSVAVRTPDVVRAHPLLLKNLAYARQLLVAYGDRPHFPVHPILALLEDSAAMSRGQLLACLGAEHTAIDAEDIDCALFRALVAGKLTIDLQERPYGAKSTIRARL